MVNFTRRTTLAMLAAAGAAPTTVAAADKPKIAFMMPAPPEKSSWSFEHARGIDLAREAYGDRATIDLFHSTGEWGNGDLEYMQNLASEGYEMIFGCSFGYMQSMVQASFASPTVKFEHCGGYIRSANLSTYSARWYEGRVVEGILAGNATKTNKIGYIASFPVGQVLRGINAAFLAARKVNPDVELEVVWLNSWFDPAREEEAARHLAENGVDVFLQHTNSSKAMEVAQELGIYAVGKATDMSRFGPDAHLMSTINNWGPYYIRRIGDFLDGNWVTEDTWGGLQQEMISVSEFNGSLPNRAVLQANDAIARLSDGTEHAYVGPISRQNGSAWLAPGEVATDTDLLTMDFFVDGIKSVIPSKS